MSTEKPLSVLITQCLQRDFVQPLGPHEPLPNKLHIGHSESVRLMGLDPLHGPVAQLTSWADEQSPEDLAIIHIRDWHDAEHPDQKEHLDMFGPHCLQNSEGAELVLDLGKHVDKRDNTFLVNALTLNDFTDANLGEVMDQLLALKRPLRVGVVGVWTEAKVLFLMYDLASRYHITQLSTCAALTASASRTNHFNALDQMNRLLGVNVCPTVGDFAKWLLPGAKLRFAHQLLGSSRGMLKIGLENPSKPRSLSASSWEILDEADEDIVEYLYRDCSSVKLRALTGGFSGCNVYQVTAVHAETRAQLAPTVLKVGPRDVIGKERIAFEKVEGVLGNDAPRIQGFVECGERGGIRFAWASMGAGNVRTLKDYFDSNEDIDEINRIIDITFDNILERFYSAAEKERMPVLEHYWFSPGIGKYVRMSMDKMEYPTDTQTLSFGSKEQFTAINPIRFYEDFLPTYTESPAETHYVSYVHGDLNGANILVDSRDNCWLIDFFHTRRAHAINDLVKLENDLLYIFSPLENEQELDEALLVTNALRAVDDLASPLSEDPPAGVTIPSLVRCWQVLRRLRAKIARVVREDRDPQQLRVALLRYSAHTISFDESSPLQKKWALASSCGWAEDIMASIERNKRLRVAFIDPQPDNPGLGITICPGRVDRGRVLTEDLQTLKDLNVTKFISLASVDELRDLGVSDLGKQAVAAGIEFVQFPLTDLTLPAESYLKEIHACIDASVSAGHGVAISATGGLGRSSVVASTWMVSKGTHSAEEAIVRLRELRGPRAVETLEQERYIKEWEA